MTCKVLAPPKTMTSSILTDDHDALPWKVVWEAFLGSADPSAKSWRALQPKVRCQQAVGTLLHHLPPLCENFEHCAFASMKSWAVQVSQTPAMTLYMNYGCKWIARIVGKMAYSLDRLLRTWPHKTGVLANNNPKPYRSEGPPRYRKLRMPILHLSAARSLTWVRAVYGEGLTFRKSGEQLFVQDCSPFMD